MKTVVTLVLAGILGVLAGCNTIEGVGQDTQAAGRGIERAADQARPK